MTKTFVPALLVATLFTAAGSSMAHAEGARPGPHFGKHMAGLDANNDGKVTREEARAHETKLFQTLDANRDGAVTREEATKAHAARGEGHRKGMLANRDANKDGKLTKDELPRMPQERFKALDTNSDGALSQEELAAHAGKRGPGHAKHGDKFFAKLDTNSDGKVTNVEASAAADARFAEMDKNKDGVLSADEMPRHGFGKQGKGMGKGMGRSHRGH